MQSYVAIRNMDLKVILLVGIVIILLASVAWVRIKRLKFMKREAVRWNGYSFLDPAEPEMYDGVMTSLEYSVFESNPM